MGKFIEKLDSYELMTSLLPGTFFCISLRIFCGLEFPIENMVEEIVICYFVGLIINRVGSIIVKPCLLKVNVIKEVIYDEYVKAEKKDSKIKVLMETSNYYRSMLTSCLFLLIVKFVICHSINIGWFQKNWKDLLLLGIIVLFLLTYRKQMKFVCNRIKINNQND